MRQRLVSAIRPVPRPHRTARCKCDRQVGKGNPGDHTRSGCPTPSRGRIGRWCCKIGSVIKLAEIGAC